MTYNIVQVQRPEITFDDSQVRLLKTTILDEQTSNDELTLFSLVCSRTGLDPFARQIYGIRRKGKLSFQTSIDGYRLIADRTRKYAGSDDAIFDEGLNLYQHLLTERKQPTVATVTVWKIVEGTRCPFTASASWNQYSQAYNEKLAETWAKMPHLMLAKCAESLALRKAFPAELSGIYTTEEFPTEQKSDQSLMATAISQPIKTKQSMPRSVQALLPVPNTTVQPKFTPPQATQSVSQKPPVQLPSPSIARLENAPHLQPQRQEIQKEFQRLRWVESQIKECLLYNFNSELLIQLSAGELNELKDYLEVFELSTTLIKKHSWSPSQGKEFLQQHYEKEGRASLTREELEEFVDYLKELAVETQEEIAQPE